jgi:hypothetical protein
MDFSHLKPSKEIYIIQIPLNQIYKKVPKTDKQVKPFGFDISRILDCGFGIEELITPEIDKVDIGYGMNFVFDVKNSWVRIGIRTDFKTKDTNQTFITGTVLTEFSIDNLNQFLDNNNLVNFPDGSLEMLFGIAFSHMRAIVSKNVSGSRFTNILVPVVNPTELFKELLNINIAKFSEFKKEIGRENQERVTVSDFQLNNIK